MTIYDLKKIFTAISSKLKSSNLKKLPSLTHVVVIEWFSNSGGDKLRLPCGIQTRDWCDGRWLAKTFPNAFANGKTKVCLEILLKQTDSHLFNLFSHTKRRERTVLGCHVRTAATFKIIQPTYNHNNRRIKILSTKTSL